MLRTLSRGMYIILTSARIVRMVTRATPPTTRVTLTVLASIPRLSLKTAGATLALSRAIIVDSRAALARRDLAATSLVHFRM